MKKSGPLILFLFFIVNLTLRLSLISKGPYHIDCLYLALKAQTTLDTGVLQYLHGPGYPLTVWLTVMILFITRLIGIPDPVFAANFMSVLFSSLSLPLFYLLVQRTLGRSTALFSTILLSVTPIFLGVSVYGKSHAPSLFFLFLSLNLFFQYKEKGTPLSFWFSAIGLGLMGAARAQDMLLVSLPVCLLFFPLATKGLPSEKSGAFKNFINMFLGYWVIVLLVTVGFHFLFLVGESKALFYKQFDAFWANGVSNNFQGLLSIYLLRGLIILDKSLTPLGLITAVLGFFFLFKKNFWLFLFYAGWLLVPFLFYSNIETSTTRLYVLVLPAVIAVIGYALASLYQKNIPLRAAAIGAFLIITFIPFLYFFSGIYFRHTHALLPDYAKWVQRQTEPDARIIAGDDGEFFRHYAERQTQGRLLKDGLPITDAELAAYQKELDALLNKGVPLYITGIGLYAYDPDKKFSTFILDNYDLELMGKYPYEDWHRGALRRVIFNNRLFRVKRKGNIL